MESMTRAECKKCFGSYDKRFINKNGECVICIEHRKKWLNKDYKKSEEELNRIFAHYKERNKNKKYDAIVAFSGGKDSVYALFLAKKKYGLRPVAVTGDNGLLTQRAIDNMKLVTDKLGVDHFIVGHDREELRTLYRAYFKKTKNFCEICYLTILNALGQVAIEYDVPLMITGFAFKIDSSHFRATHRYCFEDSFERIVKETIPPEVYRKYITKDIRASKPLHLLHLFDYVNHVEKEIYDILENELGWDSNKRGDKHSDCRFHHMLGYIRWLNNDLTSLALMTPSALLRDGQILTEEFVEMKEKEKNLFQNVERAQIDEFLEFFDIDEEFLKTSLTSPQLADPILSDKDFVPLVEAKLRNKSETELVEMLINIIRPEIKRDGGDVRIIEFNDNVLKIELMGGCRACMIADQVMVRYLEFLMRKYISEDVVIENLKALSP